MEEKVDIKENYIYQLDDKLLSILLKDHSSNKNIIWATDNYELKGKGYYPDDNITVKSITGRNGFVIKPRVKKSKKEQNKRIKDKAEVFTPSWICNIQNNALNETWFSRKDVFNKEINETWGVVKDKITFPEGKTWEDYIKLKVLEISCGEAPYLVSRYDTVSGQWLDVTNRIGALDRKIRIINENVDNEKDWFDWVLEAYKSIYGFEWQGDSLLIARENLLFTFIDYYRERFDHYPIIEYLEEIAKILSWNLWQMDGLKYVIPNSCAPEPKLQMSLFEEDNIYEECPGCKKNNNALHTGIYSKIMNWETKRSIKFFKGEKKMKFDFVIGNPPYQQESIKKSDVNGQTRRKNIFHYFQMQSDKIAKISTSLIYPGARWIHQSGKGMEEFGYNLINDKKLKQLIYFPDAKEVFANAADIADGISIVTKLTDKTDYGFEYIYIKNGKKTKVHLANPGKDLLPLNPNDNIILSKIQKTIEKYKLCYLHDSIFPQKLFGIESDFVEKNKNAVVELNNKVKFNYKDEVKLLTNDRAGKAGRAKWFITKRSLIPLNRNLIDEWQVIVSSANAGGQKRDNQIEIVDNHSAFGRVRVALKSFKTQKEAENFYKYANSKIIRYTFLMTDEALTSLAKRVPDILDYSDKQKLINFSIDIDVQLSKLIGLNDEEFLHIKNTVEQIRGGSNA